MATRRSGSPVGERPYKDRVHDGQHGCVRTGAERDNRDGKNSKPG
jgi:hypothetical protein